MSGDFLKRLFWICSNEDSHMAEGLNLSELYQFFEEVDRATDAFSEALFTDAATTADKKRAGRIELLGCRLGTAREEQGFINGFRLGMLLADELKGEKTHD